MSKTIVLTGGGTAGHVMPNLALIPKLKEMGYAVVYIGTKDGMEAGIMADVDVPYYTISAGKLRRYFSVKNFTDPFKIMAGYLKARRLLKKLRPAAVFSKGGFVTVPVVFAARQLGIRVVLHESDYTPGLANKLSIPRADRVCVSFPDTLKNIPEGKGVYTGLPIRSALLGGDADIGLSLCGFDGKKPVLLIMGGSLGAQALNEKLDRVMSTLLKRYDVVHIRGAKNLLSGDTPDGYKQFGFVGDELPDIYAAADIMLSRAGATAVFEILALALPTLLIPLPKAASRGDQILNARYFEQQGYAHVLSQESMTDATLTAAVDALYHDRKSLRSTMQRESILDPTDKIVRIIADA